MSCSSKYAKKEKNMTSANKLNYFIKVDTKCHKTGQTF